MSSKITPPAAEKTAHWERRIFWILAAYVGVAAVLLLSSQDIRTHLTAVPLWLLPVVLAFSSAGLLLRTVRWLVFSRWVRLRAPMSGLIAVYFSGFPLTLTPARAGELWRVWLLKRRYATPVHRTLPMIAADRLLDLNVLAIFAALAIPHDVIKISLCIALVVLPVLGLSHGGNTGREMVKLAWKLCDKRAPRRAAFINATIRGLTTMLSPLRYPPLLALSFAAWLLEVTAIVVVLNAVGGAISLSGAAAALGLANIVGVLTFLPGGIGGQEAALGALFIAAGNAAAVAAVAVAVMRFCTLWFLIALGTPFLLALSKNLHRH